MGPEMKEMGSRINIFGFDLMNFIFNVMNKILINHASGNQ